MLTRKVTDAGITGSARLEAESRTEQNNAVYNAD